MLDGKVRDIKLRLLETDTTDPPYKNWGNNQEVLFYQNPEPNLFWPLGWTKRQFSDLGYWTNINAPYSRLCRLHPTTPKTTSLIVAWMSNSIPSWKA